MVYTGQENTDFTHRSHVAGMYREVAGLFLTSDDLQNAIRDLEGTAFPRQDISVMGARDDLEEVFGTRVIDPELAMDNPDTPRGVAPRPEEETIGTAAMIGGGVYLGAMGMALAAGAVAFPAIVSAAVIGGLGGGAIGTVLVKLLGDRATHHLQDQIERGGLLLWVRTPDEEKETLALQIMEKWNGTHVHAHDIA